MSLDLDLSLDTLIAWKRKPHAMVEVCLASNPIPGSGRRSKPSRTPQGWR